MSVAGGTFAPFAHLGEMASEFFPLALMAFSVGIEDFAQLKRCKDDCLSREESWKEQNDD